MTGVKKYLKDSGHTSEPTSRIKGRQRIKECSYIELAYSNIAVQRIASDHTYTWIRVSSKYEMGREATKYWSASNLMWQFRLLHPKRTWGIMKDGQGCHYLSSTPQPERRTMHSPVPPYLSTTLAYKETTQIPSSPRPYRSIGKELGHTWWHDELPPQLSSNSDYISYMIV